MTIAFSIREIAMLRIRLSLAMMLFALACMPPVVEARGSHGGHSYSSYSGPRDSNGRIPRSSSARTEFKHSNLCPATGSSSGACPGYVIDHVQPLKRGGADAPHNMQWQTKEAAKAKDKWE